ncbi:3-oxoacyl-ACP synthase [Mycobacterium intracellulare]|uniref:3-oxoacyl-ACP synthase n=1 Tax=Mycobacterium intracellulare subsp. chimaera TaxID=222805 RepID=A0A7U5MKH6_MYCIT|nr:3-oxoacyl-ACP synthase [Mycobacterium intracellulare]ASL15170.1 ketoacyl-acyl carrier protein synthase III [Mycobacterium intracellulare subsp. chimaera]ASQ86353.1 3-oxoacyl-ACP synthase [Mycobacterium intracellulare subsp. chimaera]MCF1815336.1 3-oxoacyl-ACP synthase [Mycobacterium intracellulare subsp. intracellulare]MDM3929452.1 3-oxoacyl-ACP synthase [Mycobacterium intracellulare subsp. chimaera]MDS0337291.1 3-oxoacyl-ACP synthase [Mycobacterium intracellulare]
MGTIIDQVAIAHPRWRGRHSALHLAVAAGKDCLQRTGRDPHELDLVVNAGIYRDRNLGEPALAALIQDDIRANPEDPHSGAHGTFSFDIANGACGVLTALQIVDGFLRSGAVQLALIVASDADPGHGMSEHFPFSPAGAALLCRWTDDDYGLSPLSWVNTDESSDIESFAATVGFADSRNVLRFDQSNDIDERFAAAAASAVFACLQARSARLDDVDVIIAAPAEAGYRAALSDRLGVPIEKIAVAGDQHMHTAALAAAFGRQAEPLPAGSQALFVVAGAGTTGGAALYRQPPTASDPGRTARKVATWSN